MIPRRMLIVTLLVSFIAATSGACSKEPPRNDTQPDAIQPKSPSEGSGSTAEGARPAEKSPSTGATPGTAQETTNAPPRETAPATSTSSDHPTGQTLKLKGVSFTVPPGWMEEPSTPSAMGPVAVFRLEEVSPETGPGAVRITYFPGMKGMDDSNIARWVGQMKRADGQPCTKEDAKLTVKDLGSVRVTTVDLSGTLSGMTGSGPGIAGQRMIAAIVDHPEGPHFVKVTGPMDTMTKWADSVNEFLSSARVGDGS